MMLNLAAFGRCCVKTLLMVLNALCILVALSAFAFAVVDARIIKKYGEELDTGTFVGDVVVIVACLLLITVAVFGCIGAAKENAKMLYLYVGFLMILVILELLLGIFMSVQRYGLQFRVTDWIREDFFRNVTADDVLDHVKRWDDLQTMYECCGLSGPGDYKAMLKPISMSCCPRAVTARTDFAKQQFYNICLETATYYSEGCEQEILFVLREGAECLLGVAVICLWFEAAGMLLAVWMANNLRNEVKVYRGLY